MRRACAIQLFLYASSLASFAQLQALPVQQAAQKIVTLNFNAAVLQTAEAQRDLGALQAKFTPRQAQLQTLNDQVEALRKQLDNTSDKLSDPERAMRAQSLDSKEKQLQREAEDFKNDSQGESQQAFQRVAQKVYAFLQTYSTQQGYTAVIERGSDTAPVVWYAAANVDITDQLLKAYNAQAGVAAPKPLADPSPRGAPRPPKP